MNSMPLRQENFRLKSCTVVFWRIAVFTARSTFHHRRTMFGFALRQASTSGCSSFSGTPISSAPMAFRAPTPPP